MTGAPDLAWLTDDIARRCRVLADSFAHLLGRPLLADISADDRTLARRLYEAPVVIVSHGNESDPLFWFANRTAQRLWEMDWSHFTRTPSRLSAEADERAMRETLLRRAEENGYIDDYRGVRISASGRRFRIEEVILWNLADERGQRIGQAATFAHWTFQ
ncbi:MAG TPA: MEKHLA domain-containing protein [Planctomycetota bacterium]|nr:MEKHLA domain-containing protein [Planctomycetota bacterium]